MDIFLYEGIKTIYRFGISFLIVSSHSGEAHILYTYLFLFIIVKISLLGEVHPARFKSGEEYWNALFTNKTDKCPRFFEICNVANDIGKGFFSKKCVPARAAIAKIETKSRGDLTTRLGAAGLRFVTEDVFYVIFN